MRDEVREDLRDGTEACTHQLISDTLFPFLFFSFGSDHRSISLEYSLQFGVSFASLLEHV